MLVQVQCWLRAAAPYTSLCHFAPNGLNKKGKVSMGLEGGGLQLGLGAGGVLI